MIPLDAVQFPYAGVQGLGVGGVVSLFELDLRPAGFDEVVFKFSPHVNDFNEPVVWRGERYTPLPIWADGFSLSTQGAMPRPRLRVANGTGLFSKACAVYDDFIGARLTRARVLTQHLPEENFIHGKPDSEAPNTCFYPDVWIFETKVHESWDKIEWELSSPFDFQGVMLPPRVFLAEPCAWAYRSAECGYTGPGGWDELDNPCPPEQDECGGRLNSCFLRHPGADFVPFGGFPGVESRVR